MVMLMRMKEFREEQGVWKRGAGSLETLQQGSLQCEFPPVQVLPRIRNTTCLHFNQDHKYFVIHTSEDGEIPSDPEDSTEKF